LATEVEKAGPRQRRQEIISEAEETFDEIVSLFLFGGQLHWFCMTIIEI
jgi:hypothetical protein